MCNCKLCKELTEPQKTRDGKFEIICPECGGFRVFFDAHAGAVSCHECGRFNTYGGGRKPDEWYRPVLAYFSYEWVRYRVIYRFFGEYSKASFKLCHYQFLIRMFLIGVRNGFRDRSVFILKRPFFAVVNGFKELESIGTFYWIKHWIHRLFT